MPLRCHDCGKIVNESWNVAVWIDGRVAYWVCLACYDRRVLAKSICTIKSA